ncbi:MAG: DoxX family protein [Sphingobacteriales bacterium]|nr:DoxX family protein [Sphingobacteriales bacterium]
MKSVLQTDNDTTTIIIWVIVGVIFLSEGIQKFILPQERGAGRFEKIGFYYPEFFSSLVGSFEIVCGILIIIGLLTRLAVIPLIYIMLIALSTTKYKLFMATGFWNLLHESRTDWAMLLSSIFLLIKGGGKWSIDKNINETSIN